MVWNHPYKFTSWDTFRMFDKALREDQEHLLELSTILSLQLSSSKWQATELTMDRFIHEKRMDKVTCMYEEGILGWEHQSDWPKENSPCGGVEFLKRKVLNSFVDVLISSGNRGACWRHRKVLVQEMWDIILSTVCGAGRSSWGLSVFSSIQLCPCGQWQNLEQSLANGQDSTLRNNS